MDVVSASISSAPIAVRSCASVMRRAHSARSPDLFLRRWSTSSLKRPEDPLRDRGRKFLFLDAGMGVFSPCFRLIAYPAPTRLGDCRMRCNAAPGGKGLRDSMQGLTASRTVSIRCRRIAALKACLPKSWRNAMRLRDRIRCRCFNFKSFAFSGPTCQILLNCNVQPEPSPAAKQL